MTETGKKTGTVAGIEKRGGPAEFASGVKIIFSRELAAIFDSSFAYIYFIAFSVLTTGVFMNDFFIRAVTDMTPYFRFLPLAAIVFMPALTMKMWAEEKRTFTYELLMTLPLGVPQIVLGKYLAVFIFYLITLCGSLPIPLMLGYLGDPDAGLIFSGYIGAALLGALFIALGEFTSGLTSSQIVAFVLAAFAGFILVFSGNDTVVAVLDGLSGRAQAGTFLYESISIAPHYDSLLDGAVTGTAVFYFAAMSGVFLWMNCATLNRSRI